MRTKERKLSGIQEAPDCQIKSPYVEYVERTVRRIWILMLEDEGLKSIGNGIRNRSF